MEIKELRVGNLVADGSKITEVTTGMLSNWEVLNRDFGGYQPIELTEDWLIRFGFEKNKIPLNTPGKTLNILAVVNGDYFINLDDVLGSFYDLNCIKYAHQLQNLYFALTNEELKLKEL